MSHFRLHTKKRETEYIKFLVFGLVCLMAAGMVGYVVHSIGPVRARSQETVLIHTEEEFMRYLLDKESEEYNLNGRYQLEADLDLSGLENSIGTNIDPFTGKMDGNGHVISGLARPLFGVMNRADVENLFFSETKIQIPFTYYDGKHYVDGYGALAAYVEGSEIRNCGMNGEINTASPSEAEYQLSKATPSDAEKENGPGIEGAAGAVESSPVPEDDQEISVPGVEEVIGGAAGPGMENGMEKTSQEESAESGPGMEHVESSGEEGMNEDGGIHKDEIMTAPETETSVNSGGERETSIEQEETGAETESGAETETKKEPEAGISTESEAGAASEVEASETAKASETAEASETAVPEETIGFRFHERQHLLMKIPEVADIHIDEERTATPSDATPSDAQEPPQKVPGESETEMQSQWNPSETEELEYIGNPDGDLYILVTADRITAGGLIGEASGETLISESFALVEMNSEVESTDTYAGGLIGVIKRNVRLENSYAAGLADVCGVTGGFAALNNGNIQNCYSSMIIGVRGTVRGAFTAAGEGSLSGCVYDRQMACTGDGERLQESSEPASPAEAEEFSLLGLRTADITGVDSRMPGTWRKTENAYPQLEYFALHEEEAVSSSSKASAIALILPGELTLADVVENGDIVLPSEIDGEAVAWEAEGSIKIDEKNQVISETASENHAAAVPHNPVMLKSALSSENETFAPPDMESDMESETKVKQEESTVTTDREIVPTTDTPRLTAQINGAAKTFQLNVTPRAVYTNWDSVLEAYGWDEVYLRSHTVTLPDGSIVPMLEGGNGDSDANAYQINSTEAFVWFAYHCSADQTNLQKHIVLGTDLDFSGIEYGGSKEVPLLFTPIGGAKIYRFKGVIDGDGHTLDYLNITDGGDLGTGSLAFIRYLGGGTLKNLILGKNSRITGQGNGVIISGFVGSGYGTFDKCINYADVTGYRHVAGFISVTENGGRTSITNCANYGNVTGTQIVGGFISYLRGGTTVMNCYNLGTIKATGGGQGVAGISASAVNTTNCYNAGKIIAASGKGYQYPLVAGGGTHTNDFVDITVMPASTVATYNGATELTTAQMKSWGAAYALNGQKVDGVWKYTPGEYPSIGTLDSPVWTDIGQGILDGLVPGDGLTVGDGTTASLYEISNAEQLAVFAAKVNTTEPGACGMLKANIDLTGAKYHGTESDPILWEPMGTGLAGASGDNIYTGTFAGRGHIIYGMKVKTDGCAGLFGCVGASTTITKLGLDKTCSVEAVSSGSSGQDGTAGFVGAVRDTGVIGDVILEDCYNRAEIRGKSAKTGAFIGSDESTSDLTVMLLDCYTTGPVSSSSGVPSVLIGSSNGNDQAACGNCYWDEAVETGYEGGLTAAGAGFHGKLRDCLKLPTAEMKSRSLMDRLNTGGTDWEWISDKNNAYPTFRDMGIYTSWMDVGAAASEPETASATEKGSQANPYLIWSAEDLAWVAYQTGQNSRPDICAKLMTDISLFGGLYTGGNGYDSNDTEILARGLSWYPIGSLNSGNAYTGTFDGNGHVITKIHLTGDTYQGLFGVLGTGAVVKNTRVKTILGSASNASFMGGIAGYANGTGIKITECGNEGSFTANGSSVGGCLGYASSSSEVVVEGCYNGENGMIDMKGNLVGGIIGEGSAGTVTVRNCYNRGRVAANGIDVGGIAGTAAKTVSGCYNSGQVSGADSSRMGGIKGGSNGMAEITGCVTVSSAPDSSAVNVTLDQLKTWGAAFHLNGEKVGQDTGMSWEFEAGTNGGFPYLIRETPKGAGEWDTVMEGVANGLVTITKPTGTPYEISSADQLAWFAYEVNHGKADLPAMLVGNIDMKNGEARYIPGGRLSWNPAGDAASPYAGTVSSKNLLDASDTGTIYQIQNLYIHTDGTAGVFGTVSGGNLSRIGLVNADITSTGETGNAAGGIAGEMEIGAVSRCYNRKEGAGTSRVTSLAGTTSGGFSGGIVGRINGGGVIVDCYNLDTEITAEGANARVGGITGGLAAEGSIQNSYNAVQAGGKLEAPAGGQVGSIVGQAMAPEMILRCWRDAAFAADQTGISDFGDVSGKNRQDQTNALNTMEGSGERLGVRRAWYTSLLSEATRGLPTMEAPEFINVTLEAADSGSGRTVSLSPAVPESVYRGIREESAGEIPVLPLTAKTEVSSQFYTMGTENANKKIGLAAGSGVDLSTLSGSLTDPAASTGAINSLVLYTGGAYTYQNDRVLLIDVAASGVRYEIRAVIPGVASKLLNVSLPVKVGIEDLNPVGSKHTSYSADLTLNNKNDYPIKGKALDLTPIKGEGYVVLKPVAKTDPYGSTKQLADPSGGVKLGIADTKTAKGMIPGDGIYYTPAKGAAAEKWMEYQIKGKGVLPYRYFIEYEANPYYSDTNKYGYTVSYSFGISKEDMESGAEAVAK